MKLRFDIFPRLAILCESDSLLSGGGLSVLLGLFPCIFFHLLDLLSGHLNALLTAFLVVRQLTLQMDNTTSNRATKLPSICYH